MARFEDSINFVMAHEVIGWPIDAPSIADGMADVKSWMPIRAWFTDDPADRGGATSWGCTLQTAHKYGVNTKADLFAIQPGIVETIYRSFWKFNQIESQNVATKFLDMAVNMGTWAATRVVQQALGDVDIDGAFGPKTLAAINDAEAAGLLQKIAACAEARYLRIAAADQSQQRFLRGWVKRARALP